MGQRIIKFKAKKLSDGEWVEGDLYHNVRGFECCIGQQEKKGVFVYPVDPATVCQFTGLKDRDGNEVWEGDILEREIPKGTSDVVIRRAAVEFDEGHFALGYNMTYPLGYTLGEGLFRVVGNVFDEKEGEK